jgi:hypothetical protein
MATSVLPYRYRVNGLIDTSKTVMQNLELIANSCATWITYDIMDGKWSVVINRAGDPVHDFDDSNIIGGINLSGTGLSDFYNSIEVKFPHRDLADQMDFVKIEIPAEDRLENEPDNCLTMELPVMNEPIQAQIVGLIELKQSRLDKIINFRTDYSKINLQAGQIVTVTNSVYGWTDKEFRIIRMEEADADGTIVIDITALEYDDAIYDLSDLYRYTRTNKDGLITKGQIGQPGTPQITKYEEDANPRIEIASAVPDGTDPLNLAGIVEGMEFWTSADGTNYVLLNTLRPAATNVFVSGETVTFAYNNSEIGNLYVKTRCVNSATAGPFSTVSSTLYDPVQIPNAIKDGSTSLLNSSGGGIATLLGIGSLIGKVGNAIGANASTNLSDAIFSEAGFPSKESIPIFDTFQTTISPANTQSAFNTYIGSVPVAWNSGGYANAGNGAVLNFTLGATVQQLMLVVQCPLVQASYQYYDNGTSSVQTRSGLYAYMPAIYQILRNGTQIQENTADWQTQSIIMLVANATPANYQILVKPLQTYDLNQSTDENIWFYSPTVETQASGGGITITAFGFSVLT